jgi:uncharacterized protein (TIGR00106 family)
MSVLTEFAAFPTDKGISVSENVARVIEMIRDSGVSYQLTPMGTILETETLSEALAILDKAAEMLEKDSERIYMTAKFDIRQGKSSRMKQKIQSIQRHIGNVQI